MAAPTIRFFASNDENRALGGALAQEVARCLRQPDPLNGDDLLAFERSVARISGRRHAVAVGSCTDALFFALVAAGVGPGDEVLVPAFSFIASASAVLRTGAQPVFVDIGGAMPAEGGAPFTMDLERAAEALTPRTRAMLWVGLFGGLADPQPIVAFAERTGVALVEDAAQGFGGRFGNQHAGGMGLAGAFSFDRQKTLSAPGTGGAVVTNDDELAATVRSLRWHGAGKRFGAILGYNSQLSNLSAAVLNLKLARLPGWIARRQSIAAAYEQELAFLPVTIPRWPAAVSHARHKFVLLTERREDLQRHLDRRGIPTRRHYETPLPAEPVFAQVDARRRFPLAHRVAGAALSLPIHPFLSDADVARVIEAIREFYT